MEKATRKTILIITISLTVAIVSIIIAFGMAAKCKTEEPEKWVLKSYGNSVALFNGKQIVEVYSSIVLDTLPDADKKQLDSGIAFMTKEEALSAIEDYDG